MSVFHKFDLARLNTMTKYPSILTYHKLYGQEAGKLVGSLKEELNFDLSGKVLFGSEKVDGTNTRIIFGADAFVVGSREELLWHSEDLLHAESSYIVETMKGIIAKMPRHYKLMNMLNADLVVVYGETYGHKINGAINYTTMNQRGFRLFDVAVYSSELLRVLDGLTMEQLSCWREKDTTRFVPLNQLAFAGNTAMQGVGESIVPSVLLGEIPTTIPAVNEWLHRVIPESKVALSEGAKKKPEGVVVRTNDRSVICKIRFEDYNRAIRLSSTLGKG